MKNDIENIYLINNIKIMKLEMGKLQTINLIQK